MLHRYRKQVIFCATANLGICVRQTKLAHVEHRTKRRHLLNLSKRRVKSLDVKYEHFWKLHENVPYLGLCLFVAAFTGVQVVDRVFVIIVREALHEGRLVLKRLSHKRIAGHRFMLALNALYDSLHDARENFVDNC